MVIRTITSINRDISLRRAEKEAMSIYNEMNNYEMSVSFEANSYILGGITWPGETPSINIPSPLIIPSATEEGHKKESFKYQEIEQKEADFLKNVQTKTLFSKEYSPFAALSNKDLLPIRYSCVINYKSPKIILHTFLSWYDAQCSKIINCKFLKYSEPIPSVLFVYNKSYIILIGCSIKDNSELILEEKPKSQLVHSALVHQITLGLFGNVRLFCGHFAILLKESDILLIRKRFYNYSPICAEIHLWKSLDFNLIFETQQEMQQFIEDINSSLFELKTVNPRISSTPLSTLTEQCINNKITSYTYLLGIN